MEKQKAIFDDFKSEAPKVIGSTTINHEVRVRLKITADEFCFMIYMEDQKRKNNALDLGKLYSSIGYDESVAKLLYSSLVNHGFLGPFNPGMVPIVTERWTEAFSVTYEFDKFWFVTMPTGKKKAVWTGPKPDAERQFKLVRKKHSLDYIIRQRDYYFQFLGLTSQYQKFERAAMGGAVFLNADKKRYAEDWKQYCDDLKAKYNPVKPPAEAITIDNVKKAFEQ